MPPVQQEVGAAITSPCPRLLRVNCVRPAVLIDICVARCLQMFAVFEPLELPILQASLPWSAARGRS